jgi:hypothetical protein
MPSDEFTPEQEARIQAIVREALRAALKRPIRIELAALGPIQIDAETFVERVWPEIERRIDDDLGTSLGGVGVSA